MQKKLKIVQQITRRKELFVQWIQNFLKDFNPVYFVLKVQRKLKIDEQITKGKKLSPQ